MNKKMANLKVFDAISAPQRQQILRVVYNQGSLGYVEIMNQLNLNPSRDAGKFAYHLRTLRQAGLIDVNKTTKKYKLTSLGTLVVDFSQNVEEQVLRKRRQLLVRTSRLAIEEFDRNKIIHALRREAGVPIELSRKIAVETEERLLRLDTLYLTAPLIREFVNAVLIEKGLQEYRHKLTRLGIPVYDVSQHIKKAESSAKDVEWIDRVMGKNVMTEYVLLEVLPREIADAHLSGQIHLSNINAWILKQGSFQHDLRPFFQEGYGFYKVNSMTMTLKPPRSLEDALTMASVILCSSGKEVTVEESINHFNIFLSPFVKNVSSEHLKSALRRFLFSVSQGIANGSSKDISLGIDLSIPLSLEKTEVKTTSAVLGTYGEYLEESLKVCEAILDLIISVSSHGPLYLPRLILNLTPLSLKEKEFDQLLLKAHLLTAKYGTLSFVNLVPKWQEDATYFATGTRLASDWTGDWELDTIRTGSSGIVVINLPGIAYSAKNDERKFFDNLYEFVNIAVESLRIRYNAIEERIDRHLLPFLSQRINDESYLNVKNVSLLIGFVGLYEAVKTMTGKHISEDSHAMNFAMKIVHSLNHKVKELSSKFGLRIALSQSVDYECSRRLAELDVERFGWRTVCTRGSRSSPYYTVTVTIPLETDVSLEERLRIESSFHPLLTGGHLSLIELEEAEPEALLKTTRKICQTYDIGAYAFTRRVSYCFNCQSVFDGFAKNCPKCKTTKAFVSYSRLSSKVQPLMLRSMAKMENVDKRIGYRLV